MIAEFVEGAAVLTPTGQSLPDLNKFMEKLRVYRGKQTEIEALQTPQDIGWLRVSAQPIKQALCTYTNKWIFAFTSYLSNHVVDKLTGLHEFMETTKRGLGEDVGEDDAEALKRVMSNIRDVRMRMEPTRELFKPLQNARKVLKDLGIAMDNIEIGDDSLADFMDMVPSTWDATVNDTFIKK